MESGAFEGTTMPTQFHSDLPLNYKEGNKPRVRLSLEQVREARMRACSCTRLTGAYLLLCRA
jgi:hypothetical protein